MFTIPEQFSVATKTNLENQLAAIAALTTTAFEGVTKVVDLNISAAKASLEDSATAAKQLLAAKDPQEFFSLTATQAQPSADKAIAYGRNLAGIASSVQAEFTKAAEAQIAETSRKVAALVDDISKNAPAGSEQVVALVKSSLEKASEGYEQFSKSTKKAVETVEANLNTAVEQFSKTTAKTTSRSKK